MPPLVMLLVTFVPAANCPAWRFLIALNTALSTFFSAEVRMYEPRYAWSASTPMPCTPSCWAADSAPSPHPPATWKTTFDPCWIWLSAISLHLS